MAIASGAVIALLLVLGQPAAAGDGDGPPLLPDLLVEDPTEVVVYAAKDADGSNRKTLRLSHTTSNVGAGPLEIYPDLTTSSCAEGGSDGRVAYQVIYGDDNLSSKYDEGDGIASEEPVGCMIFHDIHNHYHFEDFALYELYRERSGKLKATSEKMSFCVFDLVRTRPQLDGSPTQQVYSFTNCDKEDGTHGISVGWADIYGKDTQGQELNVTGKRKGRYCLVARADPIDRLAELGAEGEANNATETRIYLNKRRATPGGFRVRRLDSECRYSQR